MKTVVEYLGKVSITVEEEDWSIDKAYDRLTLVTSENEGYISRTAVPKGVELTDTKYWKFLFVSETVKEDIRRIKQQITTIFENLEDLDGDLENIQIDVNALKSIPVYKGTGTHDVLLNNNSNVAQNGSTAEGSETQAIGVASHAEGSNTKAGANNSHAEGEGTEISTSGGHVEGTYNYTKEGIHIIGIGEEDDKKDAEVIDTAGNKYLIGVGGYEGTTHIGKKTVQTVINEMEGEIKNLDERIDTELTHAIFDVTKENSGATFTSLSVLLSSPNLSTLIPTNVRTGGMTIRFVQSSDNKYVQYRLMADDWSTNVSDWQGVDKEPTAGSKNLVESGGAFLVVKLAKIGSAGNPTDLSIGDFYYPSSGNKFIRVDEITQGEVTRITQFPIKGNMVFVCNGSTYCYNGDSLTTYIISKNTNIRNIFNYGEKRIPYSFNGEVIAFYEFTKNLSHGMKNGFLYNNNYVSDTKRVSTELLNCLSCSINVLCKGDIYIAGVSRFNENYGYVDYVAVNAQSFTLEAGYYYSVVLRHEPGNLELSISDALHNFYIGKEAIFESQNDNLAIYINNVSYSVSDAGKGWYSGTTIGETLSYSVMNYPCMTFNVSSGDRFDITLKGGSSGRAWYILDAEDKVIAMAESGFNGSEPVIMPNNAVKFIAQSDDNTKFSVVRHSQLDSLKLEVININSRLTIVENQINNVIDNFKSNTQYLWAKLSRTKTIQDNFVNIGFIGDSWTQGTENYIDGVATNTFEGYVKHLSKILWDKYGYGGLGWLDFACDSGNKNRKMFGCAEMYEHWQYSFAGDVSGLDGNDSTQAPNCLGICCAHMVFSQGSSLTFTFDAGYLDKFFLRYYKNAHFNVSINDGAAVEVTANSTDNWQETLFGTTGTDITKVVITSLADNSVIFGMDCFYGNHGVRCHKIGNRSIKAENYLAMNESQWQDGMSKLNLCWASVLLAINDLGGSTSTSKMDEIVSNINALIERLKTAYTASELTTLDINLLGVVNIESETWQGLEQLASKQKEYAYINGYGWCDTGEVIGKSKDQFTYNGTFSDGIHLNSIGSYAYAKHIYNSLFKF